jgi:transcriptional regulator with XRE-family HTH domain
VTAGLKGIEKEDTTQHSLTQDAVQADRQKERCCEKKLSTLLRQELEQRGIHTLREAAVLFGISVELVRGILNRNRIPKDKTLLKISRALALDPSTIIRAAHRQKLPREAREFLLAPESPRGIDWARKRKWPLSHEQCEYLGAIMKLDEIQLIRKFRQFSDVEKIQAIGYLNYHFANNRILPPVAVSSSALTENDDAATPVA